VLVAGEETKESLRTWPRAAAAAGPTVVWRRERERRRREEGCSRRKGKTDELTAESIPIYKRRKFQSAPTSYPSSVVSACLNQSALVAVGGKKE
jgi:hypothetical protein